MTFFTYCTQTDPLYKNLNVLTIDELIVYRISIAMYKTNNDLFPSVLNELYKKNNVIHNYKKAYDRVNHWALFKKLLKRSISVIIVRILMFWYSKQEICIKWGNETSTCFTITNGVRQDGILSPTLFSIYMDDLSLSYLKVE